MDLGQFDRQLCESANTASRIGLNHTALRARSTLGKHESVDNERLVERRAERVACPAPLGG
jgi:hypothetical protein